MAQISLLVCQVYEVSVVYTLSSFNEFGIVFCVNDRSNILG